MDKGAENMEEIPNSLSLSMHTEVSEIINIDVSEFIDETVDDFDELMYCDDLLEEEEDTGPRPYSTISEESGTTYPSHWCCSPDSEISEMIEPFHQNIDEVVRQVCQSFLYSEYLETEAEAVQTPEPTEAVRTPEPTEAVRTPEPTEAVQTPEHTEAVQTPEHTEAVRTPEPTEAVRTPEPTEAVRTPKPTEAITTPKATKVAEVLTEDNDVTPEEIRDIVLSPPSASSPPSALQVVEIHQPQSQLLAKPMTDFEEEMRGSLTLSTLGRQSKGKRKKLQWRRCFSGWRRHKIHPAPPEHFEEAVRSASADLTGSTEDSCQTPSSKGTSSTTSCSSALKADHRFIPLRLEDYIEAPEPTEAVTTPEHRFIPLRLEDYIEEDDQALEDTRDVSSLSSTGLIPPDHHVAEVTQMISTYQGSVDQPQLDTEAKRSDRFSRFFNIFSKISEMVEPFHQNIDEVVRQVCQSFLYPEYLETEAEAVQTPEPTEAVRTPEPTEAVRTPEPTEAVQTPEPTEAVRTPEPTEAIQTSEPTEAVRTPKATKVAEVLTEDNDVTPEEIRDIVPSPPSASSPPSALQVVEIHQPQSQLLVKPMTDFDEEVRGSLTLRTLGRQSKGKRKKLQWRRCFSGWRRQKIHPAPPEHFEEADRSASTDLTGSTEDSCQTPSSKETSSTTSCSSALKADHRFIPLKLEDYIEAPEPTEAVTTSDYWFIPLRLEEPVLWCRDSLSGVLVELGGSSASAIH
ncbi:hypothetical protein ABVT39_004048 [Epinephelus coioides]